MIELNLAKVAACLVWQLEILAVIRVMCVKHDIDNEWCRDKEEEVAKLLWDVRGVVKAKGNVLVVKPGR